MSDITSTPKSPSPKAPKPRHHRSHTVLRMSSPELERAERRQRKSSAKKCPSFSADTFCGVVNCRHCSQPTFRERDLTRTSSPSHHGRRAGLYMGQRIVPKTKVSQPSRRKDVGASTSKKSTHRRSRHNVRSASAGLLTSRRRRYNVRTRSPRPPRTSLDDCHSSAGTHRFSRRPSPAGTHMPFDSRRPSRAPTHVPNRTQSPVGRSASKETYADRKTRYVHSTSRKNRFTRRPASQLDARTQYYGSPAPTTPHDGSPPPPLNSTYGSPIPPNSWYGSPSPRMRSTSRAPPSSVGTLRPSSTINSPTSCQRSPSASPPVSHAGSNRSSSLAPNRYRSYSPSTLKKHAHCRKPNCTLRKQYNKKHPHETRHRSSSRSRQPHGKSKAASLGRPENCTCVVLPTLPGKAPLRPEHEESPDYLMKPKVDVLQRGDLALTNPVRGVWYTLSSRYRKDPTAGLEVVGSGDFNPSDPRDTHLGYHYSCYDELHGAGESARIIELLEEKARQLYPESESDSESGVVNPQYPTVTPWSGTETDPGFTRAVDIGKAQYRAAFPFLDRKAAEQRARDDVYWLGDQYLRYGLQRGMWIDPKFTGYYGAWLWNASG